MMSTDSTAVVTRAPFSLPRNEASPSNRATQRTRRKRTEIFHAFASRVQSCYPFRGGWEADAAQTLKSLTSFAELQRTLRHGEANQTIVACFVLSCLELSEAAKTIVGEMLSPLLGDERVNDIVYGEFFCDEERPVSVNKAASDALILLGIA